MSISVPSVRVGDSLRRGKEERVKNAKDGRLYTLLVIKKGGGNTLAKRENDSRPWEFSTQHHSHIPL